jgi:hypothetical protein
MAGKFNSISAISVAFVMILAPVLPRWGIGPHFCSAQPSVRTMADRQDDRQEDRQVDDGEHQWGFTVWDDKIRLGLSVELNGIYADIEDEDIAAGGDLRDAYIGAVGFRLNATWTEWLSFDLLAELEDIGKHDDSATVTLSEAFVTLHHPQFPVYFIGGKRTLPFGVFEDRMISGPLTEELYEIVDVGATLGIQLDALHSNLSFTLYEGQHVIENLEQFNTHQFADGRRRTDRIDAYILRFESEPIDDMLSMALFFDSEPGDGRRNETIGTAATWSLFDVDVDVEYITALKRESGENGGQNLETAWISAIAYQPVDAIQAAVRYEHFDDDRGEQDQVVDFRYLAGLNYFINDNITVSVEYRHTEFETEKDSDAADAVNEYQLRLAFEY